MEHAAWVAPCVRKYSILQTKDLGVLSTSKCSRPGVHHQQRLCKRTIKSTLHQESKKSDTVNEEWNGENVDAQNLISNVKFNDAGLIPAIAQQWDTGEILMMAWMNVDSIVETMRGGRAVYYSRSRKQQWRKGDTSGQIQLVRDVLLDCDGDTILLKVDQLGVACHTGRRSCFFKAFRPPHGEEEIIADVLMDPKELYKK